jgi:hypothetical protein
LQPYDSTEFKSKQAYQVSDLQKMIEQKVLLSVPYMSEETKFSAKGDTIIFKLRVDLVKEQLVKKYISPRVSCTIFI